MAEPSKMVPRSQLPFQVRTRRVRRQVFPRYFNGIKYSQQRVSRLLEGFMCGTMWSWPLPTQAQLTLLGPPRFHLPLRAVFHLKGKWSNLVRRTSHIQ